MKLESFKSFTYTANSSWEFLKKESKRLKTIITDKKLRETTYLCVEIMNSKRRTSEGETCSPGTNSRLPFDVNVMFNLSNTKLLITKDYRVWATTIEGQNALLQRCALRKFHVTNGQNKRDQITSDRRSKRAWSCVLCMQRMRSNNLKIRIAGSSCRPQQIS